MPQGGAPSQDDMRELLYGIQKGKVLDAPEMPNMFSFVLEEEGSEEKKYSVSPGQRYNLGDTGPFRGVVGVDDPGNQMALVSSMACPGNEKGPAVIGEVVRSDELELRLRINVDLCKADPMAMMQGATNRPVVDHLDAEIILPFGWRYLAESAPSDIVTPGVEVYMARYHDRMGGVPGFQSATSKIPGGGGGASSGISGSGGGGAGGVLSSQGCSDPWVWPGTCTCCCAELARMKDLRRRKRRLTPEEQKVWEVIQSCPLSCAGQYVQCEMNQNR